MKYLKILCISLFAVLLMSGCEEQYKGKALQVNLRTYDTYAYVYADLIYRTDGTFEVGVCYSKASNPTYYSDKRVYQYVTKSGFSMITADFYYNKMNLAKNTTYYMRGYIKNKSGLVYSDQQSTRINN